MKNRENMKLDKNIKQRMLKSKIEIALEWIQNFDSYWDGIVKRTGPCPQVVYKELQKWQTDALNTIQESNNSLVEQQKMAIDWIKNFNSCWSGIVEKTSFGSPSITAEIQKWQKQALSEIKKCEKKYQQ